jgi:anti-anti-sigma regulatory factor
MQTTSSDLAFDGVLGIRTIEAVRATLLAALAQSPLPRIDCTAADTVDLSFLQLLLAARRSARQAGLPLRLAAPADGALKHALLQAGLLPAEDDASPVADRFWLGDA